MPFARHFALLTLALLLAACGGGEDGPGTSTVTVTPALGKVWLATVRLRSLDGTLLVEGVMGSDGSIPLTRAGSGGVLVEVEGNDSAFYFDEGAGTARRLPSGRILHAVSLTGRRTIAITALTELVYQRARALANGAPLNAALIQAAELEIATLFGTPETGSFLDAPAVVDDARDLPDAATPAGRAALRLAGLAEHAFALQRMTQPECSGDMACAPLLDFIDDVAADLVDGALDGAAHGVARTSAFYSSANAATLPATLLAATATFQARASAARAMAVTDTRIGHAYAGDYSLDCALPAGSRSPMHLQIGSDGGFVLDGPFGRALLPAGGSLAGLQEVAGNRGYFRHGLAIASQAVTSSGPRPISDGLSIGIGGSVSFPPDDAPLFVAAGATLANGGFVHYHGQRWQCSGFPAPANVILASAGYVASWLPDGNYDCETSDPGTLVRATVSAGHLGIGDSTWEFASALRHDETQLEPLNLPPDSEAHAHAFDAIAAARMPLMTLDISQNNEADAPGNQLRLRRSTVTGATYFNATLGGTTYQHCLPNSFLTMLFNGYYTRGSARVITGGRLDHIGISGGG